jgi:hypothetical protein
MGVCEKPWRRLPDQGFPSSARAPGGPAIRSDLDGEKQVVRVLRDAEQAQLLVAIDTAVSRCIDAFNVAAETEDEELTAEARACVERLKAFREFTAAQPTRASRWMRARPPRWDSLNYR